MNSYLNRFLIMSAIGCMALCVPARSAESIDWARLTAQLLSMISNTNTSDADLEEAISRLGKISEPVSFWSRIANDSAYSDQHRRRCILGLVKRHRPGTVYELARMLDNPAWLRDDEIEKVGVVIGAIPVELTPDDTTFALKLLPNSWGKTSSDTKAVVYITVAGTVSPQEFSRAVRGEIKPGTKGSDVLSRVFVDIGTWQEPRKEKLFN